MHFLFDKDKEEFKLNFFASPLNVENELMLLSRFSFFDFKIKFLFLIVELNVFLPLKVYPLILYFFCELLFLLLDLESYAFLYKILEYLFFIINFFVSLESLFLKVLLILLTLILL